MLFTHVICAFAIFVLAHGAPLDINRHTAIIQPVYVQQTFMAGESDSSWSLSDAVIMRDTIGSFYETTVDEVMSTQSEALLITLSQMRNKQPLLQEQAEQLGLYHVPDVCLVNMPGMIARHIHLLSTRVFAAIAPAIDTMLPEVWPEYAAFETSQKDGTKPPRLPEHQIATAIYSLNQAVAYALNEVIQDYGLADHIKQELDACVDAPTEQDYSVLSRLFHKAKNAIWAACAAVEAIIPPYQDQDASLLESHINSLRTKLNSELEARLANLIVTLYSDLYGQAS